MTQADGKTQRLVLGGPFWVGFEASFFGGVLFGLVFTGKPQKTRRRLSGAQRRQTPRGLHQLSEALVADHLKDSLGETSGRIFHWVILGELDYFTNLNRDQPEHLYTMSQTSGTKMSTLAQ